MIDVLLVDDESYVTNSLAKTIPWESIGVRSVYQAASSFEALELMEENAIDIVVTDIAMPEMTGLELVAEIGQRWPSVKSILLTGHSDFQYAKKAVQLGVLDYILKPVNDDEFVKTLSGAIEELRDEWEQLEKVQQLMYNRKSDLSVLRANFMVDLVLGRQLSEKTIKEKLSQYEIPLLIERPTVMLLVQLGKQFSHLDYGSAALMEFAVGNIAEESFSNLFQVWHNKAPHDYLLIMAQLKQEKSDATGQPTAEARRERKTWLSEAVKVLQRNVSNYLKGDISVVVTDWFVFPDEAPNAYRAGLGKMFMLEHSQLPAIHFLEDSARQPHSHMKSLELLYKPPTIIMLLESKRWDAVEQKLNALFDDLQETGYSREHLYEVYLALTNAFMYIAHRQGHYVSQMNELGIDSMLDQTMMQSPAKLQEWSIAVLRKLQSELSAKEENAKSYIVQQVQQFVTSRLGQDTSVKTIADRVYLHPVYLSKVFKAETGESLSEWIIRIKMERALYLLKHTNRRIYEITSELGYQNPQYFSKTFKKYYGMTPQEFREQ